MGHCWFYDEIQSVDTSLAMEVVAKNEEYGTVIPSNISPMSFIQLAADNNDFNEETHNSHNYNGHLSAQALRSRAPTKFCC